MPITKSYKNVFFRSESTIKRSCGHESRQHYYGQFWQNFPAGRGADNKKENGVKME